MSADTEKRDPGRNIHFIFDGYHLQKVFYECFQKRLEPSNVRAIVKRVTADSKDGYPCETRPRRFNDIKCNFITGRLPDELTQDVKEHELTKAVQLKQLHSTERRFEVPNQQFPIYFLQHELQWTDDPDSKYEVKKRWKQDDTKSDEIIVTLLNNVPKGDIVFLSSLDGVQRKNPLEESILEAATEAAKSSMLILLSFDVLGIHVKQRVNKDLRKIASAHQTFRFNPHDERTFDNVRNTDF